MFKTIKVKVKGTYDKVYEYILYDDNFTLSIEIDKCIWYCDAIVHICKKNKLNPAQYLFAYCKANGYDKFELDYLIKELKDSEITRPYFEQVNKYFLFD